MHIESMLVNKGALKMLPKKQILFYKHPLLRSKNNLNIWVSHAETFHLSIHLLMMIADIWYLLNNLQTDIYPPLIIRNMLYQKSSNFPRSA